jgi:hypothetical protein
VDKEVLVERVRAKLGRFVSHPHAIHVTASSGNITLTGAILEREADRLVKTVRHVRGVRTVIDNLERHDQPGTVPSLQGGRAPAGDRIDVLQARWAPATRTIVGTVGAVLTIAGLIRRDRAGAAAALVGAGLIARAATNMPVNRLAGVGERRVSRDS